ncbi:hypothetical protein BDC45DRAFT_561184 [Circinella umbellata]|nr:hypothetical protein BDC45DRAFT_561184 [Circinella umbellata]
MLINRFTISYVPQTSSPPTPPFYLSDPPLQIRVTSMDHQARNLIYRIYHQNYLPPPWFTYSTYQLVPHLCPACVNNILKLSLIFYFIVHQNFGYDHAAFWTLWILHGGHMFYNAGPLGAREKNRYFGTEVTYFQKTSKLLYGFPVWKYFFFINFEARELFLKLLGSVFTISIIILIR